MLGNNGPLKPVYPELDKVLLSHIADIKLMLFDFDGVFTDNKVYVSQDGTETVSCWRSDGLGLSRLQALAMPIWVVSTEKNPVVSVRCKKLKLDCIQSCDDKLTAMHTLMEKYQCQRNQVMYVGNDINDQACLEAVGLPIVVADAHPDVKDLARYVTLNPGGRGAVREICDLVYGVHKQEG